MKNKKILKLVISLLLPQLTGAVGALFTFKAISSWYQFLIKPSFSPPNWLFGPAWTILYILMGISSFLIWQEKEKNEKAGKNFKNLFSSSFFKRRLVDFIFWTKKYSFRFFRNSYPLVGYRLSFNFFL